MAQRTNLREFQQDLTRRLTQADGAQAISARLGFRAGGRHWLVDLDSIEEVLPVPPLDAVPLTRPWYAGVANLRGTLYSVIDLAAFAGLPAVEITRMSRILLLKKSLLAGSALLVDAIAGLRNPDGLPSKGDASHGWIATVLRDAEQIEWHTLDTRALARERAFLDIAQQ